MDEKRDINVTLQMEQEGKSEIVISVFSIWRGLKRFFILWIAAAILLGIFSILFSALFASDQNKRTSALVSFTYKGIEQGKDPAGKDFNVKDSLCNPEVIQNALTQLGRPTDELESVRAGLSVNGIIPSDAMDRIITYQNVYQNATNGALSAAQAMLDVSYYSTQYQVIFDYSDTSYSSDEAVQVLNQMLDCYRSYFFEVYGYNKALGSAIAAIDYSTYDYAEAVDVFSTTLTTLADYLDQLAEEDTTRFRSNKTGYTFADLSSAVETIESMDLDLISSYITVNNVTKDRQALMTYYQYRVDSLRRKRNISQERLDTITESIDKYEKDSILIFGNGTDNVNTTYTQASEQYDKLISQKISAQKEVSTATQQIDFFETRIEALEDRSAASREKMERVEKDLADLNEKVNKLLDDVNATADEYYENVAFGNAYNVLVPASGSTMGFIRSLINGAMKPAVILEAVALLVYLCAAFIYGLRLEKGKLTEAETKPEKKSTEKQTEKKAKS